MCWSSNLEISVKTVRKIAQKWDENANRRDVRNRKTALKFWENRKLQKKIASNRKTANLWHRQENMRMRIFRNKLGSPTKIAKFVLQSLFIIILPKKSGDFHFSYTTYTTTELKRNRRIYKLIFHYTFFVYLSLLASIPHSTIFRTYPNKI